jgi:DNA-binding CsgD family transcriptional regulator
VRWDAFLPGSASRRATSRETPVAVPSTIVQPHEPTLHSVPLDRYDQVAGTLLAPLERERHTWRQAVLGALRSFMDADGAAMLLWQGGAPTYYSDALPAGVVEDYLQHFAQLDYGMTRRDALGLSLWSRHLLWDQRVLLRSRYYREFALPHDLHDAVGLSIDVEGTPAHVRVVLLYSGAPLPPGGAESMTRRLGLLLPMLRSGLGIQLRYERWLGGVPSMLDRIGERVILYTLSGRERHRNVTMRRTLEQDPDRERILEAAAAVALAVAAYARGDSRDTGGPTATPASTRRLVRTAAGRYRLRGCLVGPDASDAESAVLVSVERATVEPPSPELLRDRYGLTGREVQVAGLLVQRLTNEEIAGALGISSHTARHHTESILLKVGVKSRRSLQDALAAGGEPR